MHPQFSRVLKECVIKSFLSQISKNTLILECSK